MPYGRYAEAVERVRRLEAHASEASDFPRRMYNIIGSSLFAAGLPVLTACAVRVADLEGIRRAALQATELRSRHVTSILVSQRLRDAKDRNPYSGKTFLRENEAGAIVFSGLEPGGRGRHSFLY